VSGSVVLAYLRTDQSCPSLHQSSAAGNPIYAVYRPAGYSADAVCAAVRAAGGSAYGKWLDASTSPDVDVDC
jgi:serine/threonine-protein kinase